MELTASQVKCLLAVAENPDLGTTDNVAKATGLGLQETDDVTLILGNSGLLEITYTSIWLTAQGREAVRQIRAALEKRKNEQQLKA